MCTRLEILAYNFPSSSIRSLAWLLVCHVGHVGLPRRANCHTTQSRPEHTQAILFCLKWRIFASDPSNLTSISVCRGASAIKLACLWNMAPAWTNLGLPSLHIRAHQLQISLKIASLAAYLPPQWPIAIAHKVSIDD